ncbi:hypothetical protein K3495_g5511 [Podosphaera aphanis]|nr:hypothetical protein K3495_g5511 [Podosphaera aphanis]
MRSFTFASVLALVLSASALPSDTLDERYSRLEMREPVEASQSSDILDKRHYYTEAPGLVEVGYACGTNFYSMNHIQKSVQKGCKKINSKKLIKPKYPKIYAPKDPKAEFKSSKGNQYMHPILRKGTYSRFKKAGKDRVVFDRDCQLTGLVVQKKIRSVITLGLGGKKQFTKCTKMYERK